MVEIDATYEGGLRCQAKHGPSGDTLLTDAPIDNQGKGEAFSPTDLVATALGTCMMTIMGIVAERDSIDFVGTSAHIGKEMSKEPPRRISRVSITMTMPGGLSEKERQKLERAAYTCPVHKSVHPDIEIPVEFVYPD